MPTAFSMIGGPPVGATNKVLLSRAAPGLEDLINKRVVDKVAQHMSTMGGMLTAAQL